VEKFEKLRHQVLLYNSALDESLFVDEFLEGLKPDIRTAIHLHQPKDLDTASLLALLQEEEMESTSKSSVRNEFKEYSKLSRRHDRSHKEQSVPVKSEEGKK
jgi:hypothetical protein